MQNYEGLLQKTIKTAPSYLLIVFGLILLLVYGGKALSQLDDRKVVTGERATASQVSLGSAEHLNTLNSGVFNELSSLELSSPDTDSRRTDNHEVARTTPGKDKQQYVESLSPNGQDSSLEHQEYKKVPRINKPQVK